MSESHPSTDLFYFLYVNCDAAFRRKYEDILMRNYFSVFSHYVTTAAGGDGGEQAVLATYEEFKAEADKERRVQMLTAMMVSLMDLKSTVFRLVKFTGMC